MTPGELHNIYSSERDFWWYRGMRAITDVLLQPLIAGGVRDVLDAGCGTGFNALDLERRYGLRVFGVDLAKLGVAYCRERGLERSAVASIVRLPFADSSFDMVLSFDVLYTFRQVTTTALWKNLSGCCAPADGYSFASPRSTPCAAGTRSLSTNATVIRPVNWATRWPPWAAPWKNGRMPIPAFRQWLY